ncbi:helix-turn-helix transcriptional regulator [Niabella insulamsoli]|uniref:helix-turn-helix transcriptional regulator n=1 Tax=Niabella insulamsoli TaxID=3144874 RepID=UPI003D0FC33C
MHPGIVLERELKRHSIKQRPFAILLNEHPQTFNAITKGKRGLPVSLAVKIEKELNLPEGSLAILQTYYDINQAKQKLKSASPDLSKLRKALFWDTDINKIDWEKQYTAVIQRVFARGNDAEKKEMKRFYGIAKVKSVIAKDTYQQSMRLIHQK